MQGADGDGRIILCMRGLPRRSPCGLEYTIAAAAKHEFEKRLARFRTYAYTELLKATADRADPADLTEADQWACSCQPCLQSAGAGWYDGREWACIRQSDRPG